MEYSIYKKPLKVSLTGLVGLGMYFFLAILLLRSNEYYYLILGAGVWGVIMLFMKSVGSKFISTFTVTDESIRTVTSVGGIIEIRFKDLDWDRTCLSEAGLILVSTAGESVALLINEFSTQDILRLAHHIGMTDTGWFREL